MGWPRDAPGQIRAIQQLLVELKLLHEKPDGVLGPMTRNALRDFQRRAGLNASGEPSREVYAALLAKQAAHATSKGWSLPPPQSAAIANDTPAAPASVDSGKAEPPPPPPNPAEIGREPPQQASAEPPPAVINLGKVEATPPPTSADIAATPPLTAPAAEPAKPIDLPPPPPLQVDASKPPLATPPPVLPDKPRSAAVEPQAAPAADVWPSGPVDQIKAIQALLNDLRFYRGAPTGRLDAATRTAIRDYQRTAGLKETGETSKALFDSLKEMRAMTAPKHD